jgi:hypothetical protein
MQITKVEQQKNGYLVNEAIFVPQAEQNADYQAIQKWIVEGGIVEKEDQLPELKLQKISQIKLIRDQKNTEPLTDYKAFLIDEEGNKTAEESYFVFYTNRHQTNPASDPDSIISRVTELGSMPYFTKDLEGKKITVELTAEIAALLKQRIFERNDNNYKVSSVLEEEINNAQSIEELQALQLLQTFF